MAGKSIASRGQMWSGSVAEQRVTALTDEQRSHLMAIIADSTSNNKNFAAEFGWTSKQMKDVVKYLKAQNPQKISKLRAVKSGEIVDLLTDRAYAALEYITDADLAISSAKDKAIVAGILLEKRQLLRGEPTVIMSHEERMGINELVPRLMKELQRRGIDVGGLVGDVIDITPTENEKPLMKAIGGVEFQQMKQLKAHAATGEPVHGQTDGKS